MANLDTRLSALESRTHAVRFSPAERQHAWNLMAWRARMKLVESNVMPDAPSPEWAAEMGRDIAGEDIEHFRGKLFSRFPEWRTQMAALSDLEVCALNYEWATWARQEQLLPGGGQTCLEAFLNDPDAALQVLVTYLKGEQACD